MGLKKETKKCVLIYANYDIKSIEDYEEDLGIILNPKE